MTEFCVILLCFNPLFALVLQNEIQLLSRFFCYSWLACLLVCGWEMRRTTKKKIGNHRFLKKPLLVSLLRLARCVRRLKSLSRFWPYLMSFRAASRPVSVSNNIAFDFFFWFHKVEYCLCRILSTFVRFETMIWPSTELKKSLDIFWPRLKKKTFWRIV